MSKTKLLQLGVAVSMLLLAMVGVFVFVQGAGFDPVRMAVTTCDYGMVPGELTHLAPLGAAVQVAPGLACYEKAIW